MAFAYKMVTTRKDYYEPLFHGFSGSRIPVTIWLSSSGKDTFRVIPALFRSELEERRQEGPIFVVDERIDCLVVSQYEFVSKVNLVWSHISVVQRARTNRTNFKAHNAVEIMKRN